MRPGQKQDAAARAANSAALKARWLDPDYRDRVLESRRLAMASPEVRERVSDGVRRSWETRADKLPAMSDGQKQLYRKCCDNGLSRDAALAQVLKIGG